MTQTKQHKWFNLRLYVDMLRQLKLVGFILAGACVVITLLPPTVNLINGYAPGEIHIAEIAPALWGFIYLGGAGLIYAAFSYLTQRNACDFYYSLPSKARAIYLSNIAAVATWILGTVVGTVLLGWIGYGLCGAWTNFSSVLCLIAYFTSGTLLVAACATIAVCISGTKFSNLTLTALILFLPRFLLTMVGLSICEVARNVPQSALPFLLTPNCNVTAMPFSLFTSGFGTESLEVITSIPAYLYTLGLALVWFALGLWLYCRRRSETAGQSAPSRLMQHVYRCALTVPLLAVIGFWAITDYRSLSELLESDPAIVLVLVALSAILYFAYELITTKRFKNLLSTLPLFLALAVAIPLAAYLPSKGIANVMLSRSATAEELDSVQIALHDGYGRPTYSQIATDEIDYESETLLALLAKAHERTINDIEEGFSAFSGMVAYEVTFDTGFSSFTRKVALTERENRQLRQLIMENPKYIAAQRELPKPGEVHSLTFNGTGVSDELWKLYLSELSAYSGETYDKAITDSPYVDFLLLSVSGDRGVTSYRSSYPLNSYTPKTLAACIRELNARSINSLKVAANAYADPESGNMSYGWVQIDFLNCGNYYNSVNVDYNRYDGTLNHMIAYVNGGKTKALDPGDNPLTELMARAIAETPTAHETIDSAVPMLLIRFSCEDANEDGWSYYDGTVYLPVTELEAEEIFASFMPEQDNELAK